MYIFVLIILAILYVSHLPLYHYLVKFFALSKRAKKIAITTMVVIPMLFIASMISMHFNGALPTRLLYFITGLWHGILVNFLLIILLSWGTIGILRISKVNITGRIYKKIGLAGIVVVIILSSYGVCNVFNIKVRNISLTLANTPEYWKGKKAVHISDVHLGSILRDGHMQNIIEKINTAKPDIILITGDLFDSVDGNVEYFQKSLKSLDAPEGVFFITGNHEVYLGIDKLKEILNDTNIKILENEVVDINGLQIVGVSYPDSMRDRNLSVVNNLDIDPEKTSILLYHEPIDIDSAKKYGIDLMLSGHTHKGQMLPFNFITNKLFKGYDYGFFDEGDFHLYVTSGAGIWGPTIRTSGSSEIVVFSF